MSAFPSARTPDGTPASPLGARCARCQRYLLASSRTRRTLSGRWRHESCDQVAEPTRAEFSELAGMLMETQPWPRLQALTSQLTEVVEELAELRGSRRAGFPSQAGPPAIESLAEAEVERERALLDRTSELHGAIAVERSWKAHKLAAEWVDGQ